ncbi:MAG: CHRD domain-containing protein [Betaproteobacteria bacterium]
MHVSSNLSWSSFAVAIALAVSGAYSAIAVGADMKVTLAGDQEVPAVTTAAKGGGTVTIGDDMSVKGTVTTSGIAATAAHIHMAAAGKNGPVIVPMVKSGDNGWTFAAGAKLTEDQMKAFKAGELYVNVHSAANPGGEIRGQLK